MIWCFWKRGKSPFRAEGGRRAVRTWHTRTGQQPEDGLRSKALRWTLPLACRFVGSPLPYSRSAPQGQGLVSFTAAPLVPRWCPALSSCSVDMNPKPGSGICIPGRVPAHSLAIALGSLNLCFPCFLSVGGGASGTVIPTSQVVALLLFLVGLSCWVPLPGSRCPLGK